MFLPIIQDNTIEVFNETANTKKCDIRFGKKKKEVY